MYKLWFLGTQYQHWDLEWGCWKIELRPSRNSQMLMNSPIFAANPRNFQSMCRLISHLGDDDVLIQWLDAYAPKLSVMFVILTSQNEKIDLQNMLYRGVWPNQRRNPQKNAIRHQYRHIPCRRKPRYSRFGLDRLCLSRKRYRGGEVELRQAVLTLLPMQWEYNEMPTPTTHSTHTVPFSNIYILWWNWTSFNTSRLNLKKQSASNDCGAYPMPQIWWQIQICATEEATSGHNSHRRSTSIAPTMSGERNIKSCIDTPIRFFRASEPCHHWGPVMRGDLILDFWGVHRCFGAVPHPVSTILSHHRSTIPPNQSFTLSKVDNCSSSRCRRYFSVRL